MSGFWERRRRAVAEEERREARAVEVRGEAEVLAEIEALPEAEQLERLGLPDPDSLMPGDDVRAFMRKTVPAVLRNRALRRLWTSNPVLANLDGLVDYADDYTGNGLKGGALATSYQVGKGLARHVEALAREAETVETRARQDADGAGDDGGEPDARQEQSEKSLILSGGCDELGVADSPPAVGYAEGIPPDADPGGEGARAPRRMAFSFEEETEDERPDPDGPGARAAGRPLRRG
jgi:hypothetical protein